MHLYSTQYRPSPAHHINTDIVMKVPDADNLTLTALVAPVSMTRLPTFGADQILNLKEEATFHVEADKIPDEIRCSCLRGGRFCLLAEHYVVEYGPDSPLWLGKNGLPQTGSLIRYIGKKKGGKWVIIAEFGERVCCTEEVSGKMGH